MQRRTLLRAAPALALPLLAQAQDGRGGRFEDDLFSHLAGRWRLTRQIGDKQTHNTVQADWVLQHQFLRLQLRDVATPSRYEADVYIGYSHAEQVYVAHWLDNFGGRFSGLGRGQRQGLSVAFRFDFPSGPFLNTFRWEPDTDSWHCHLESVAADGTRRSFARDHLVRDV